MSAQDIGAALRTARIAAKISVKEASAALLLRGIKATEKTIYSWETGNSQPSPDALLILCEMYGVSNVLDTFGYNSGVTRPKEKPTGLMADELTENEKIFVSLPPNLRQEALKYMRYLAEQEGKR